MTNEATSTPASQMARYEPLIGTWRTSGEILGERGESAGRVEGWDLYDRLGETYIIHRVSVDMDGQQVRAVEVIGPELGIGTAATRAFGHDGSEETSTSVIEAERVFTFGSEGARAQMEIAEDGATGTATWERSDDGGTTWRPWMRLRFTRQADDSLWP
jgi:hypothetical protein